MGERTTMKHDRTCLYCKRGKLSHLGNNIYECNICIRGSFYLKPQKKLEKNSNI